MKPTRHTKILEIIGGGKIGTQQELRKALMDAGYDVTQATVSRDIKDLKIIKVRTDSGEYSYAQSGRDEAMKNPEKFAKLFAEAMIKADNAQNLIIIKSYPGMANAVCALIDAMEHADIVGTIAGDDTIFIAMKTVDDAVSFKDELNKLIG